MSDKDFLIRVRADIQQAVAQLKQFTNELDKTGDGAGKTTREIDKTSKSLDDLKRIAGGYLSFQFAKQILLEADAYNTLQVRIQTATRATGDYNVVSEELFRISQQNGVELGNTVGLFQNLARSAEALEATNRDILDVSNAIQQLGVISGASREALSAGVMQLSQALGSGKLQGDELRSIMENLPELANRLAKGLGMSVGELRDAGAEGRLLSKDVFDALLKQVPEISAEFEKIPPSLARSGVALQNSMSQVLSRLDNALGLTQAIATSMNNWAAALETSPRQNTLRTELDGLLSQRDELLAFINDTQTAGQAFNNFLMGVTNADQARASLGRLQVDINRVNSELLALQRQQSPGNSDAQKTDFAPQENVDEINKIIKALQDQAATYGKNAEQIALYKLALLGANEEQLNAARGAVAATEAQREYEQAQKDQAEAAKEAAKAEQERLDALAEAIASMDGARAANLRYNESAAKLHDELTRGAITYEEYAKKMDQLDDPKAFDDLAKAGESTFSQLEAAARGWGDEFTNTLADMVQNGKLSFSDLADAIISDLLRIMIYQNITAPLFGGLGIPGFSAPTNHTGGIAGLSGSSKIVNPAVFLGAPRLHYGGIAGISSNEVPTILEKGEEVLTTDDPRHRWNQSSGNNVRVEIVKNGTPIEVESANAQFDFDGAVVTVFLKDYDRGGPISKRIGRGR